MSRATAGRWALALSLVLLVLGVTGLVVESRASTDPRPEGIGFGLPWSHELHARHPDYTCQSCHHDSEAGQSRMRACDSAGCHPRGPVRDPDVRPGAKAPDNRSSLHAKCVGCHIAAKQGPTKCEGCHVGNRGTELCGSCHRDTLAAYQKSGHRAVPCSGCHSTIEKRRATETGSHPRPVPKVSSNASCLDCHAGEPDLAGFPSRRFDEGSRCPEASAPEPRLCVTCHKAHNPERR